ncbi:hypothetical protein FLONG3_9968 [Fusarium longipes]|uniref:LysM domain-containing protein n=1 Tax=Fusarium longipes TaxID=694270 RepID=A0A395RT20_9HYPO|nr:hypothetical protein FLONG3_9968 [Fusarium longipes]
MKFTTIVTFLFANGGMSLAAPTATATEGGAKAISSVTGDNTVTTPLPIQPGMVDNCDRFYFVKKGDGCASISKNHGISFDQFKKWNPSVGNDCLSLWADANVCVHTIGFEYPVSKSCFNAAGAKPWAPNQKLAMNYATEWCLKSGAGKFDIGEKKETCVDAKSLGGSIEFEITNGFGIDQDITVAKCKELLAIGINGCEAASQSQTESWSMQ